MKTVNDVSQQAADGSRYAVSHVGSKFFIGFGKMSGNFTEII